MKITVAMATVHGIKLNDISYRITEQIVKKFILADILHEAYRAPPYKNS